MIRPLNARELAHLSAVANSSMMDTCIPMIYSVAGLNAVREPFETWTDAPPSPCGLNVYSDRQKGKEIVRPDGTVVISEARLRLPLGTSITERDRVRITHRLGAELPTPETWEIVSPVKRGPTALVMELARVWR